MPVVQIHSGAPPKVPEIDQDLIAVLESLLEHAKAGQVRGYCAGFVIGEECDHWFMADEGYIPLLSFVTRKAVEALESDD